MTAVTTNAGFARLIILVTIFIGLFGPKLFSVIDLSLLAGVVGIVLLSPNVRKIYAPTELLVIAFLLALITIDTVLMSLTNRIADTYPIMRQLRALLSTVLLGCVFYFVGKNAIIKPRQLINLVLICLLINAIVVLLQIQVPAIKSALANVVGFDKRFVPLRAFGLTAGYDTAGYLCVFGGLLASMCAFHWKGSRYLLLMLVFIAASIFTSRSTMLLASLLATGVVAVYLVRGRPALKFSALLIILAGTAVFYWYVLPLMATTFKALEAIGIVPATGQLEFLENFASTGINAWIDNMWVVPSAPDQLLFGAGFSPAHSDLGYVKIIYMIGLFGMALVLMTYGYLFAVSAGIARLAGSIRSSSTEGLLIIARSTSLLIFSLIFLNLKNLYFLTRGYHELIVILVFAALGYRDHFAISGNWKMPESGNENMDAATPGRVAAGHA